MYTAPVPRVFLAPLGPLLLVLHALVAVVLGGAGVHQAVLAVRILRGRAVSPRLLRVYSLVAALAYAATLLTGGLLYPRYRYFVRGLQLDRDAPWAANLFDFKENLATLGLPLAVGTLILASGVAGLRAAPARAGSSAAGRDDAGAAQPELVRPIRWIYGFLALGTAAVSLFNVIAGLIVTGVRGG